MIFSPVTQSAPNQTMAGTTSTIIQVFIGVLVAVAAVLLFIETVPTDEKGTSTRFGSIVNITEPVKVDISEKATNNEPSETKVSADSSESAIANESLESSTDARATEPALNEEPLDPATVNTAPEPVSDDESIEKPTINESPDPGSIDKSSEAPAAKESEPATVEVLTKLGKVKGTEQAIADSRTILAFKGIPYAQPPVGELRFKAPVPIGPWSGVKGGQTPPACPQVDFIALTAGENKMLGEEDCLYLNIYVPKNAGPNLPVMVFIHGGGFYIGNADMFGGTPKFLLTKDIILVSIQYRLGVLGFLSTGDPTIPGNFGMKDQSLALRWVQENIREFGGDPGQVTIFGQSAGGASVHLHVLSPYSEGMFQRAILMSGTALGSWAIREDPKEMSRKIGKFSGCLADGEPLDSTALLECLRGASVEDITMTAPKLTVWNDLPFPLVPCVDGDFLPDHPAQLLKSGRYQRVDIMAGITANEMVMQVIGLTQNKETKKEFLAKFEELGPLLCALDEEESGASIMKNAFYNYMDGIEVTEDYFEELDQLVNDCFANVNCDESILIHASDENAKVYAYELEYQGKGFFLEALNMIVDEVYVPHGADLPFLFNNVLGAPDSEDPTDLFVSKIMVQLWTDFAIKGNPTPDLSLGFKWLPVAKDSYHYLGIGPAPSMRNDKRAKRREFWKQQPTKSNKILYEELFAEDRTTVE
ncbi:cocaine esterase-like isoform X1 [Macrobrachium rosenbergii]|uniref:cocaine esterase-like isoform X1 n=2 Tax=Macrobrachium rosenbergii TaxID=79674 RepID=UPI0034D6999D